mmetsp:Transcript_12743/g.28947  ORF Transcript_12743/g.28947 Transcript_12743/m.28947 type:complete len:248 (-) Transcript_12743:220-963(-)
MPRHLPRLPPPYHHFLDPRNNSPPSRRLPLTKHMLLLLPPPLLLPLLLHIMNPFQRLYSTYICNTRHTIQHNLSFLYSSRSSSFTLSCISTSSLSLRLSRRCYSMNSSNSTSARCISRRTSMHTRARRRRLWLLTGAWVFRLRHRPAWKFRSPRGVHLHRLSHLRYPRRLTPWFLQQLTRRRLAQRGESAEDAACAKRRRGESRGSVRRRRRQRQRRQRWLLRRRQRRQLLVRMRHQTEPPPPRMSL